MTTSQHPLRSHPGTIVVWGNPEPHEMAAHPDAKLAAAGERTKQAVQASHPSTISVFPEGTPLVEALMTMTGARGIVAEHASGGVDFVASSDPMLAQLLASHYGCEQRDLTDDLLEVHAPTGALPGAPQPAAQADDDDA